MKEWTHANWARFEEEKPEWFHAADIARMDEEMIPENALVRFPDRLRVGNRA